MMWLRRLLSRAHRCSCCRGGGTAPFWEPLPSGWTSGRTLGGTLPVRACPPCSARHYVANPVHGVHYW